VYLTRPKKPQPPPKVGAVVSYPVSMSSRYAVVVAVLPAAEYRHPNPDHTHTVRTHYVDGDTGRPMECPDRARCEHGLSCPIHGRSFSWPRHRSEVEVWDDYTLAFYAASGMLTPEIAAAASTGGKLVKLDTKDARIAAEFKAEYGGKRDR
jgi:hypothetical protein